MPVSDPLVIAELVGLGWALVGVVVLGLKGRIILFWLGVLGVFPILWAAPFLIAHPDSRWARRFYSEGKLAKAIERETRRHVLWAE